MFRKVSTLAAYLVLVPVLAWAQNSGKLAGTVVDRSTNEPLPGATVVIDGTQMGTATNANGEYFIIGVPVGNYTVRASFVGYESLVYSGVGVSAGYTRQLDFALGEDVAALGELVVEYERPLIQKDAIGVPKVVTGEEIENLPVRGIAGVAALQGGVVNDEGSNQLNIRGGRDQETVYFVDGVKVIGSTAVAQGAIQEQEMLIGSLPAKYGDAMSGVISITTKSGGSDFFGSLEGITSEVLDDYGYNLGSLSLGGPLVGGLSFFVAGELEHSDNRDPRAVEPTILDPVYLNALRENPQVLPFVNTDGDKVYVPLPGNLADGASLDEALAGMDVPAGYDLLTPVPINGAEVEPISHYSQQSGYPNYGQDVQRINGNLTFSPSHAVNVRLTGRYQNLEQTSRTFLSTQDQERATFASDRFGNDDQKTLGLGASWTHRLSNSTFYQVQADWSTFERFRYDRAFSHDIRDLMNYGDIDNAANSVVARYKTWNADDSMYVQQYADGSLPAIESVYSVLTTPGGSDQNYLHNKNSQFRLSANATTQVGLHQIEFGGEYEQRTQRFYWAIGGFGGIQSAAKYNNNDAVCEVGSGQCVSGWDQLPYTAIQNTIDYYGYNYLGTKEADSESIDNFVQGASGDCNTNPGSSLCDLAPYEPIYYAGYVQDKIEYKDLVLNLGLRVDVFDNNSLVLKDRFALVPITRASEVSAPSNIGGDYAVYFDGSRNIVGYRDLDGNFFDANGQQAKGSDINVAGAPEVKGPISSDVFKDYSPQTTWMPRIGVSFPVTDQALFFAHYDKTSERPYEYFHDGLEEYYLASEATQTVNNNGLEPTTTTEYELGFRQRVGARSAFTVSGFYKSIDNLIQLESIAFGFPNGYSFFGNNDFGTVRGVQFEFDLRRTNNVSFNANYTLQFANGTGSDGITTTQIAWRGPADGSGFPNFLSPLDFDRRHSINLNVDYRLGKGEGPTVGGASILENFGFNIVANLRSGKPYTPLQGPNPIFNSFILAPKGSINGEYIDWSTLVNLRVDRKFDLGDNLSMTAFLWVQNLLNVDNTLNVFRATGLPGDDGWRQAADGRDYIRSREIPEVASFLYGVRVNDPTNYGIPRLTRLGLRVNF